MYDDNKIKINWIDFGIKAVLIIALVIFLIWLVPKKDVNTLKDSIYSNNINEMKDVAKSYYTKDRLPKNVGQATSMTLKEMINKKLIVEFTDKDGKVCDESTSKVEVTKLSDDEYVLKVELNCGDQKDYILETIGCYDVCENGNCDVVVDPPKVPDTPIVPDTPNGTNNSTTNNTSTNNNGSYTVTTTYYQFRKPNFTNSKSYTCPDGYTLKGTKCYKDSTGAIINATPNYSPDQLLTTDAKLNYGGSYIQYIDPIVSKVESGYTCPSGYTLNGAYCIKYTSAIINPGYVSYTCPNGYSKEGSKCTYSYFASYANGTSNYTCPNGGSYDKSKGKCVITKELQEKEELVCPSGYKDNGTSCYKLYAATAKDVYTCPSGKLSGTKCISETNPSYKKSYGAWKASGAVQYKTSATAAYQYETSKLVYQGAISGATCGSPCGNKGIWYSYQYYTRTVTNTPYCTTGNLNSSKTKCVYTLSNAKKQTSYTCPNGGSYDKSKGKCVITADRQVQSGSWCPDGYSKSGNRCVKEYNPSKTSSAGYYYCPNGGTLNGIKCTITVNATLDYGTSTYTCPYDGSVLEGTKCKYTTSASRNIDYNYTCPVGYTSEGYGSNLKCYKTVQGTTTYYCEDAGATLNGTKCTKKVPGTIQNYTCPSNDYVLNGTVCSKKTTIVIDATAVDNVSTSYEYTWSTNSTLDGWEFTGKTKTDSYTAYQK